MGSGQRHDTQVDRDIDMTTTVGLFDSIFPEQQSATLCGENDREASIYIRWARGAYRRTTFYTDDSLYEVNAAPPGIINVAWLLNLPSRFNANYEMAAQHDSKFTYVLTYNQDLLMYKNNEKWRYLPLGGASIDPRKAGIHGKQKLVSMFIPDRGACEGSVLQEEMMGSADLLGIDLYTGSIDDALSSYMYSIVVEDMMLDGYFSHRLIDCFSQGTIPIYYGSPVMTTTYFDTEGMIFFNNLDELFKIVLNSISKDDYYGRKRVVQENFEQSFNYRCAENLIMRNYPDMFRERQ